MFMRILQLNLNPDYISDFKKFYEDTVEPRLQNVDGCLFASLIKTKPDQDEYISLTFWKTQQQAENYEHGEVFENLTELAQPYLYQSGDEWKIQLSENMEIQYTQDEEEPTIKKYNVEVQNGKDDNIVKDSDKMFLRIVSLKIQEHHLDEFKKLYADVVIPSFRKAKGCRNAFLTQSVNEENDFISVSVWENKDLAVAHESGNEYKEMIDKVKHTFSHFYLWRMSLEHGHNRTVKSTDEMKVEHYDVVTGKSFI
ncbi:MAG: antibiotic biosynthesis monooxygenase [Ignavibacteriaceae bacterium]